MSDSSRPPDLLSVTCTGLLLDDPSRRLTGYIEGRATFSDGHRLRFTGSLETGFRFKPRPHPVRPGYISFHSKFHDEAIRSYIHRHLDGPGLAS